MRASRLFSMFDDEMDANVYVNIDGDVIPVVTAEYLDGHERRVILGLDRLKLLQALKRRTEGNGPR